jgi:DNA-binding Xre family transcriptional regulator
MLRFLYMGTRPKYRVEIYADEVKVRRLRLALSKEQAASQAGISVSRLTKIEAGLAGGVSTDTVQGLCRVYACSPSDISEVVEATA